MKHESRPLAASADSTPIKSFTFSLEPDTDYIRRTRLIPQEGELFVVRWLRQDGRDVRHKYFRRRHDAQAFAARLDRFGKTYAIFSTWARWSA